METPGSLLQRMQGIDDQSKKIVNGYIREHEKLFESTDFNIFNNVPEVIPCLCILYFAVIEYFKEIDKCCKTKDDGATLIKVSDSDLSNNYGSIVIQPDSKCIARWNIKIISLLGGRTNVMIGLASVDNKDSEDIGAFEMGECFYIYSNYGWIQDHNGGFDNADDYFDGDIVGVELNLIAKHVKYYRNEVHRGYFDLHENNKSYRLVVGIYDKDSEISIHDFRLEYPDK